MNKKIISWVLSVILGLVFLMFGAMKFFGEATDEMKTALGVFVYFIAAWEVIAAVMVVVPKTRVIGSIMIGLAMIGALIAHFTVLSIDPTMMGMAVAFLVIAGVLFKMHWKK